MEEIKISVVIPFYNAKDFVVQATESALQQMETGEVLLIEDSSPDGGLEVCQKLAQRYSKVKLLRHLDKGNHGAAASRNLGIKNASFPYIAFLDADDYFLPNRFARTKEVFRSNKNVDGVYEAIGAFFQDVNSKELFNRVGLPEITTVTQKVIPENLFVAFMKGGIGHFSFDGFTGRKELFSTVSYFNDELKMYEDSFLMYQLSAKGKLLYGEINKPVAMRRVHQGNRITSRFADERRKYETMIEFWQLLLNWGKENLSKDQLYWIVRRNISQTRNVDYIDNVHWTEFISSRRKMFHFVLNYPSLILDYYFWRRLIPSRELFQIKKIRRHN